MSVATADAQTPPELSATPDESAMAGGRRGAARPTRQPARWSMRELSLRAQIYIGLMAVVGVAVAIWSARQPVQGAEELGLCFALGCAAAMAQAFEVHTPNNKAYNATLAFLLASALLLGPLCTVIVAAAPF